MKILSSLFLAIFVSASIITPVFTQPTSNLARSDNQFAFDLYSRLSIEKGNVFFSPYSLSSALGMAYEGARDKTAQEMRAVLHLSTDNVDRQSGISTFIHQINRPDKAYELAVANALWAQKTYPFKGAYVSLVKDIYSAEVRNLDFKSDLDASRLTINSWVSQHTQNRINDLLPPGSISSDTRLILTDAVYFKGQWDTPFRKQFTKPDTFWVDPGQAVQVEMMQLNGKSFNYTDNDQSQILQLPYQGKDLSMLIILPRLKDIQGLEKMLTLGVIEQWQDGMAFQKVNVFLPKFRFDSSHQMSDILEKMGMKLAFDGQNADFSGMTGDKGLFIDKVYHKAWIDVDEEGTEAAGATAIGIKALAMRFEPLQPKVFRADHPFIFVIQENKTGHILFMGRVSDPRGK